MLLNTAIFNQTVETAKAKAAGNAYILRAIDRAVTEINKSKYWAWDGKTLRLLSTTSSKLYIIDENHTCESKKVCKHRIAARLIQRYQERLSA